MARRSVRVRSGRARTRVSRPRRSAGSYGVGRRSYGRARRAAARPQAVKLVIQMDNSQASAADPFKVATPALRTAKF